MVEVVASLVVDLSRQKLFAYDPGGALIYAALVSTGRAETPTPPGDFHVDRKYPETEMVGRGYRVPQVRDVMCLAGGGLAPDQVGASGPLAGAGAGALWGAPQPWLHPHQLGHGPLAVCAYGCGHPGDRAPLNPPCYTRSGCGCWASRFTEVVSPALRSRLSSCPAALG